MPSYDFPTNPSTNDTHTIGDKTWTFNGSAWEKTFSGDSIQIVGVSDFDGVGISGGTFANTNELSFRSLTPGLTLSASQTANRTLITWDALDIASRIGVRTTSWTYTSAADILIPGAGNIRHKTGLGILSINQLDSSDTNTKTTWATVRDDIESYGTSIIRLSFGDSERNYTVNAASYDASNGVWNFTISEGNDQTSGTGKSVNAGGYVNPGQNTKISASEFYRFPDGSTAETVVTSFNGLTGDVVGVGTFNGLTGDVTTSGLNLHVAGISSDGGVTLGANLNVKNDFEIRNEGGSAVFEVAGSGQNVTIGDVDSAGNGNEIFIRDSHGQITLTASTAITLNTDAVNLLNKLRHNGDINTHLAFPANDEIALTTGGVTLAHLTDTFALQKGLSLDAAGITFADGTFQSTAAGGGGSSGVTQSIGFILDGNGSPLGTGDKLDALRQIPYNSYVLSTSAYIQDGVTGTTNEISFGIKKTSALSGSITGTDLVLGVTASAEQTGFTFAGAASAVHFRELASVSDTSGSTVDANEWIFPEITGNSGDINKLQIFMTVVPTS